MILYVATDNLAYELGLIDQTDGLYVTNATITDTLTDSTGATVATVSLSYIAGSLTVNGKTYAGGNYRGQILNSVTLTAGSLYTVTRVITTPGGAKKTRKLTIRAAYDGQN